MNRNHVILILILTVIVLIFYPVIFQNREVMKNLNTEIALEDTLNGKLTVKDLITEEVYSSRRNAITNAAGIVEPAVVSVNVIKTQMVKRRRSFFFGFYDEVPYSIQGIGSGVIFSDDGFILTNAHVVEGATEIKIILTDTRQFDAMVIGIDTSHDVAVIKIEGDDLPFAKFGDSDNIIIGEWAIALGNPYGFLIKDSKPSVSVGVVSAINRDFAENKDGKIYRHMVQTDAAINPGNSGGPLVNILGEIIGINTFIFSESGGNIGIGFAIPVNTVKKSARELIEFGKIRQIWFGFKVQELNQLIASHLELKSLDGVLINYIQRKSPAEEAGLKEGDIIREINGNVIKGTRDAELVVSDISVGDKIEIEIMRNGKALKLNLKAVEYKK
ncbi:MAG: trypsin-like peptidase domain-containing protein [Candidatus Tenebribacter burtonii]|jgi:serine protease Do|nr:trypsin-like peptidase domain-containing protein [Candidatus Tenebribacter burtonii]